MNKNRIIYWVATGLLCALMLFSAGMYLFSHEEVSAEFTKLGFPVWIIYPLAIAKILGVIAIVSRLSRTLLEWAYAGFFFDVLLAAAAHLSVGDGEQYAAIVAAVLVLVSYGFRTRAYPS